MLSIEDVFGGEKKEISERQKYFAMKNLKKKKKG